MKTSKQKGLTGVNKQVLKKAGAIKLIVAMRSAMTSQHDDIKIITVKMIDGRAWMALGYNSFKAMCDEEISHYSYSYLSKIRQAYKTHVEIESKEDFAQVPEHYYRELRKAPKDHRATVWNEAIQAAGGLDALTLQHISDAAKPYLPAPKEKKPAHPKKVPLDLSGLTKAEHKQVKQHLAEQGLKYEDLNEVETVREITRALAPAMRGQVNPLIKKAKYIGKTLGDKLAECEVTSETARELCVQRLLDMVTASIREAVEVDHD